MAKNISTTFSIDLGAVVENSIKAVKTIRKTERARKEAEFQRAVADGLSYDAQVKMRQQQLAEEEASSFSDVEYVQTLKTSVAETQKLGRFNKYRANYVQKLSELNAGKINEEKYAASLKDQLNGIDDPELRLEIQNDIATAEKSVKTYHDTILSNQIKKAKYDGTQSALNSAIARVKTARAEALISDRQDEVTAFDETLSALESQAATVRVQDAMQDFQVKSATKGTNALEKLGFINGQLQGADLNTPIRIDDKNYTSLNAFWSQTRDSYLSGTFFEEFEKDIKNNITINSKIGMTQTVLDNIQKAYSDLRAKPEMAPFLAQLDAQQVITLGDAVRKYADKIVEIGTQNRQFDEADMELQKLTKRFGVDLSTHQIILRNRNISEVESGKVEAGKIEALPLPGVEEKPKDGTTKTPSGATTTGDVRTVRTGDTLGAIAKEAGIPLAQLLELNPQYKTNPNLIRVGEQVKLPPPATTPAPAATPPAPVAPAPVAPAPSATPGITHQGSTAQSTPPSATTVVPATPAVTMTPPPPVSTPASVATPPAPTPTPAPKPAVYSGVSIVDYLSSTGKDSSFSSRMTLATQNGITNYTGTAQQNTQLLTKLRGF